jgi:hypothetical protein
VSDDEEEEEEEEEKEERCRVGGGRRKSTPRADCGCVLCAAGMPSELARAPLPEEVVRPEMAL